MMKSPRSVSALASALLAVLALAVLSGCVGRGPLTGSGTVVHAPETVEPGELTFALGAGIDKSVRPGFETTLLANSDWALNDDDPADGLYVLWHNPTGCRLVLYQATTDGTSWDLSNDEVATRRAIEDYMLTVLPEVPADIPLYSTGVAPEVTFGAVRRSSVNDLVAARVFTRLGVYLMLTVQCPVETDPVDFYSEQIYENISVSLEQL